MSTARRLPLSALLAIALVALLATSADGAIVFKDRFGPDVNVQPPASLTSPYDISTDTEGDSIFVVDTATHRVQYYDLKGEYKGWIGTLNSSEDGTRTEDGMLFHPQAIATNPDGSLLYVADTSNSRVQVFSTTDESFVFNWGEAGVGKEQLNHPGGIDVDAQGNVYVADTRNHRVQKFSSTGQFIDSFGSTATEEGALDVPVGIAVNDALGRVYVTDEYSWKFVEFTTGGDLVGTHGAGVDAAGERILVSPDEITVDEENGIIYVIEAGGMEVSVFDANRSPDNSFIGEFTGEDHSQKYGFSPHGIHFNPDNGELMVAAGGAEGDRIFRYDTRATPKLRATYETHKNYREIVFSASHNALLGNCNVKATGTIKTPGGATFDVMGPFKILRAGQGRKHRGHNYSVTISDRAAKAARKAPVTVKMTFRSPGGCNAGREQPKPVTEKFGL